MLDPRLAKRRLLSNLVACQRQSEDIAFKSFDCNLWLQCKRRTAAIVSEPSGRINTVCKCSLLKRSQNQKWWCGYRQVTGSHTQKRQDWLPRDFREPVSRVTSLLTNLKNKKNNDFSQDHAITISITYIPGGLSHACSIHYLNLPNDLKRLYALSSIRELNRVWC